MNDVMATGLAALLGDNGDPSERRRALAAAIEARDRIDTLPDWPAAGRRHGLALHIGELLYGNIGAGNRLDFTCVGPAGNLAARLETVAKQLGRATVLSGEFAGHCGVEGVPLGEFALAGFGAKRPAFGLADEG